MTRKRRRKPAKPGAAGKTATKSATRPATPALVVPPHGNGALLTGGVPGNAGGTGRPPSAVRAAARLLFEERLPALASIADGVTTLALQHRCENCGHVPVDAEGHTLETIRKAAVGIGDRLDAIKALGTFGLQETRVSVEWVREKLAETLTILRETLPPDRYLETMAQLKSVWKENA